MLPCGSFLLCANRTIEPRTKAQRADRAEVESRMTGGVDPLCHGQKQLLDRPKLLEKFLLSTQFVPSRDCAGVCLRRWTGFVRVPRFDRPNDTMARSDVRFRHKADIGVHPHNVRF